MRATNVAYGRARHPAAKRRVVTKGVGAVVALSIVLAGWPASSASASHLFGSGSGWEKATGSSRRPVLVWSQPGLGVDVGASIAPWNWLAGWKLFRKARSRQAADVVFLASPNSDTWTECPPAYLEPFDLCFIHVADPSVDMTRHELGHALGFGDHIRASDYAEGRHFGAKVCDSSDHPEFSAYHGVMSYCDWMDGYRGWFGPKDRNMLARAGYLSEGTLDSPGRG